MLHAKMKGDHLMMKQNSKDDADDDASDDDDDGDESGAEGQVTRSEGFD